jgi:hypothetical protein
VLCIFPIAGATALTQVPRSNTGGLLASYYVAQMLAGLRACDSLRGVVTLSDFCRAASLLLGESQCRWDHQACCDDCHYV